MSSLISSLIKLLFPFADLLMNLILNFNFKFKPPHGIDFLVQHEHMQHDHSHMHHVENLTKLSALDFSGFASIFSFSFLMSLHCALMCVPLVCALLGPKSHFKNRDLWIYNLGRAISYTCMGFLMGTLGLALRSWSEKAGNLLSWLIGLFLIVTAIGFWLPKSGRLFRQSSSTTFTKLPSSILSSITNKAKTSSLSVFLLGLATVILPCMTLTPTLGMAAGTQSGTAGALTMLAFYLGTLPAMVLGPGFSAAFLKKLPLEKARKLGPLFLLLAGIITLWRIYH